MVLELILSAGGITTLFLFIITLLLTYRWKFRSMLPPGPIPYPLIGNMNEMIKGKSMWDVYRRLQAKYGDIFTLRLGRRDIIVFNGYDTLREAFIKRSDVFSDRPNLDVFLSVNGKGIVTNSGEQWKQTRMHTLSALREFGFGRKSLQCRITEEVEVLLNCISQKNGEPFDIADYVFISVSNVICSIAFGNRFDHNNEEFQQLTQALTENFRLGSFTGIMENIPIFKYLPGDFFNIKKRSRNFDLIINFCGQQIKQHKNTYDDHVTRDLIDAFIREERKYPGNFIFSEENLRIVLSNLFVAGTETTSTTIRWAILYMIHYPEIQEKLRQEILSVVGSSRQPTMDDKPNLPYVEAFIIEVLRCANITPNSIPHSVSEDTIFYGYRIPKTAVLIMNLDSVFDDPELFPDPKNFNPARFIGKNGKVMGQEKVIAFSIGGRQCLGEALARMELFLFLMHEKEIYTQRQTILEEIELIRRRETDVKREAEINDREKKLQAERIKAKEDDLRNREQSIKRMEVEYQQKLSNEMTKFKVEQQAKFMERTQNLEVREARVKDEERRISDEKEHIFSIKDQLKDKTARVNELETIIQEEKHREVSVSRQNEHLNSKIRDMADYKMLKEQNVVMKNEVETLRTRLAELLSINERERGRQEEMMRELRRPTPETLMYQRDLEKARESLRQEQTLSAAHRQTIEQRLQDELDRNRDLLRRFEEQTFQMKEMNREIVDLRGQLNITHKALSNEVFRKPREDGNRSVSFQTAHAVADFESDADNVEFHKLPGEEFSKSPRRSHKPRFEDNDVYNDIEIEYGVPSSGKPKAYSDLSDGEESSTMSADIVAETKYRLKNLEKEAQNLDKVYQEFQYQMTNPVVGPLEPIKSPKRRSQHTEHADIILNNLTDKVPSPQASPIHRPMSSTPYQQQARTSGQHVDDSLHELTAPSSSRDREHPPPRFDLSNMSDEDADKHMDERLEKPRPITVSDLEARPGSPSIVVVPGSASSGEVTPKEPAKLDDFLNSPSKRVSRLPPLTQEPVETPKPLPEAKLAPVSHDVVDSPIRPPPGGKLAPLSLDSAWKAPPLEDAWKKQDDTKASKKEEEAEIEEWEEQRRKREEERKQREDEAWEREQQELQRLQEGKDASPKEVKVGHAEEDDGIDPVMKQYMAMIQQQKEKEAEKVKLAKKTVDTWSKGRQSTADTPTQSEQDLSVADDEESKNESDAGDFW